MNRKIAIVAILLTGFLLLSALSFVLMQRHWDLCCASPIGEHGTGDGSYR